MADSLLKNQTVLVTGASGLIGSNLAKRLVEAGAVVRATFNRTEPKDRAAGASYVQADLARPEECKKALEGVIYVFHCAAYTPGAGATARDPLQSVTSNIAIDANVFDAAYRAGVRKLVWLGSTTAYPPTGQRPVREEEMFSGDPFEKYFFVGWSKRITEVLARMYGEKLAKPMTTIVLRLSYVYGPGDNFDPAVSHVIPALIRKVVERQDPLEVWGTGEDVRDPIFVDDVVDAMLLAAEKIDRYDVFNIGLGKGYRVKDMLDKILELDGFTGARIQFNASKPSMIPVRLVDVSKAERLLGFRAKTDLDEGLQKTIDWYRARSG